MHPRVLAQRKAIANKGIIESATAIAASLGLTEQALSALMSARNNDPAVEVLFQQEALVNILSEIADKLSPGWRVVPEVVEATQPTRTTDYPVAEFDAMAEPVDFDFTTVKGIGAELSAALNGIGLHSLDDLRAAPDKQLLEVSGISRKSLDSIRREIGK